MVLKLKPAVSNSHDMIEPRSQVSILCCRSASGARPSIFLLDMSTAQGLVLLSSSEVEEKCRTLLGTFKGCGYGDPCQFGNIMEKWGPVVCSRLEEIDMQLDAEVDALRTETLPKKKLKTFRKNSFISLGTLKLW